MGDRLGALVVACLVVAGIAVVVPGSEDPEFETLSAPSTPARLVVESLDLRAPVVPVELSDDGVLDPPDDASVVGWWTGSKRPGAANGQTVLTGHTVRGGGGVMDRLGRLGVGDRFVVRADGARVHYEIDDVSTLSREQVAERSVELFSQDRGDNRMLLITCTGWDGSDFTENVVVSARQLGVRRQQAEPEDA